MAIELLDIGEAGVGVLNAAIGAGAVLGSILTFRLVGRGGLAAWFGLGIALWGTPLIVLGVIPEAGAAIVLLAVVGIGNALIDVGGFTMLARLADETVLARMFAAFEAILTIGIAAGALLTPLLLQQLDIRATLVAVGVVTPIAVVACWAELRRLDGRMRVRDADIELLQQVPMLRALPQPTIEQLAAALEHAEIPRGRAVFQQGAPGDLYYIVERGPRRWCATASSSRPSGAATGSARSRSCALAPGRRPSALPLTRRCASASWPASVPDGGDGLSGQHDRGRARRHGAPGGARSHARTVRPRPELTGAHCAGREFASLESRAC